MALQALAHDINLAIAKQSLDQKLFEPGVQGGELDAKQHLQLAWRDGLQWRNCRLADQAARSFFASTTRPTT